MRPDGTGGIGGEPTGLTNDMRWHARAVRQHFRRRMTVRHDLAARVRQRGPGGMGLAHEVQIGGVMHREERGPIGRRKKSIAM